jgi:hypothetical protein
MDALTRSESCGAAARCQERIIEAAEAVVRARLRAPIGLEPRTELDGLGAAVRELWTLEGRP